ncbi:MAG: spore germination protein GerW family protein [Clostridia bacterium]|nr:spore germination protein GerW family protein [Clostridia bacterium]
MFDYGSIQQNVSGMMEKLEKFLVNKTVVGEQIQVGEVTIIPLLSIGFGMGAGLGDGRDEKNTGGAGGGGGMGATVKPVAMMVIKNGNVEVIPVKKASGLEKLVEMVPGLMEKVNCCTKDKEKTEEQKCCE